MTKAELEMQLHETSLALNNLTLDNHRLKEIISVAIKYIPEDQLQKYAKHAAKVNNEWGRVFRGE